MSNTSIVVPCYNEAARLQAEKFRQFAATSHRRRVVFVNDGSRDNTLEILHDLARQCPSRIGVLDQCVNQGKAEAVRQGMLHAIHRGADYVGFWDADLATPLDAVDGFCAVLDRRPQIDVVIGSRLTLSGRHIERSTKRRLAGVAFARAASLLLRLRLRDTQCGAKLFRVTPDLVAVLSEPFLAHWIFDVEIFARMRLLRDTLDASHLGDAIYELPLDDWRDVAGSKLKSSDFVKAGVELVRIWWRYQWRLDFAIPALDQLAWSPTRMTIPFDATDAPLTTVDSTFSTRRADAA